MFANQSESHAISEDDLEDFGAEAAEDALELYDADVAEPESDLLVPADDDDAGPESSLDELLARRAAKAALQGEEEDGGADLPSLLDDGPGAFQVRAAPPKRPEFVCSRCRLVKPRVQLSDATRSLCRDCA
jgi:hypothetical protein